MDEIDEKYEFNAPKFIDFLKGDQDEDADKWFDEKPGDEGGIDIDLVPYYESVLSKDGFKNATSAITAALNDEFPTENGKCESNTENQQSLNKSVDDNKINFQVNEKDISEKIVKVKIKEERKSLDPPMVIGNETNTNEKHKSKKENFVDAPVKIKQERQSVMPSPDKQVEEEFSNVKIKQERKSHVPTSGKANNTEGNVDQPTDNIDKGLSDSVSTNVEQMVENLQKDLSSREEEETVINSHDKEEVANNSEEESATSKKDSKDKIPPRKSNIRTTWDSPINGQKKLQRSNSLPKRTQPPRQTTKRSVDYSDTKKRKHPSVTDDNTVVIKKTCKLGITAPETPSFVRKLRERGAKKSQSSESIQLNKIRELQKQTREQMKRNDKSLKNAIKAPLLPNKVVSAFPVTKPKEFHFATDYRFKEHAMQTRADTSKPFETQLRQHPTSPSFRKEATKPKPFHFNVADKPISSSLQPKKWESIAQSMLNYQTKTPERFRARPKKDESNGSLNHDNKKQHPTITHPKTPNLMTKSRSRPVTTLSAQEIEDKELEDMKNYQFKATEFNPKIVEKGGLYGVKQLPCTHTTAVKPFHFESDDRINQRKQKHDESAEISNANISKTSRSNTSINSKQDSTKPKKTEVKPFSFESRDKERYTKKEEKIKEYIQEEEKMREFHARPLPSFSPETLPVIQSKAPTCPEPFKMSHGSIAYQQKLKHKLQQEEMGEKAKRVFKAQPSNTIKKEPFKPLTGLVPPTNALNVTLNSEIRAKERAKFEEWKHKQEVVVEEAKLRIQREKEEAEEREMRQLRKEAVPKAHGIRHYKPVEIQKGLIPATEPQTPHFETKRRAMIRQ